jgi:hypothetical protein
VIELLPQILWVLGAGFLIANVRVALEIGRWMRRRRTALTNWPASKPPYYGLSLGIGVMLAVLILLKAYLAVGEVARATGSTDVKLNEWLPVFGRNAFGELMMFVYFGYALPLSTRIRRGLYADGIWTDTGFVRYDQIGGITWRDGDNPTLVVISRLKTVARRLIVPGAYWGEVRRLLRDKITAHAIEIDGGPGLHLGARDARDSI